MTSSVGTTAAANQGKMTIDLKPIDQRKRSAELVARDLMASTATVSSITTFVQNPPAITRIGGLASRSLYQYTLPRAATYGAQYFRARDRKPDARDPGPHRP